MDYQYNASIEKKQYPPKQAPAHAVISLTIKQLLSLKKENEIDNQGFNHIVIVGKIVSTLLEGNKRKIKLVDGTGMVEIVCLIGDEKSRVEGQQLERKKGLYFFIACTPKIKKETNQWVYFLDKARQITKMDEISKHLSDIMLSHLERTC